MTSSTSLISRIILFSLSIFLITACAKESTGPQTSNAVIITRANMYPDSTVGWLYYSIDGDSVVPPEAAATTKWDVKFAFLPGKATTRIDILLNSGTVGSGSTLGAVVNSRFENLTDVPDTSILKVDDASDTTRIIPLALAGSDAVFIYSGPPNHTITPSPDKVIFIKTNAGALVKFQVTSIYFDAPPSPTLETPLGYYHFRYAKANAGKW